MITTAHKAFIFFVAATFIFLSAGCSSFNHQWRQSARTPISPDSMEGRWQGQWISDANGHYGKLLCIVTKREDGDYAARFRATYKRVLNFSYTVRLKAEQQTNGWHFRGEENLGKLAGGVYRYEGTATSIHFHSTYYSRYDHGTFEMTRP